LDTQQTAPEPASCQRIVQDARRFSVGNRKDVSFGREGSQHHAFNNWIRVVGSLPRRQTRVLTWPVLTVMGFLAQPSIRMYLKPTVTRKAAERYRFDFSYESRPTWQTYSSLLNFAHVVGRDLDDMGPRDMIDIQSFLWVQGSDEYPD
jgi:hypothetical protein